ncbi:LmbE-like protein [Stipitochalara longipes BDJ]|nr:LmbE-like protein [Stipitochalara longipes BDJ]
MFLVALPIIFFASWFGLASFCRAYFPPLQNKRIGLLIAHCDDEAMFFSPTLQALTKLELKNHVEILCLSPGAERHLCETRKSELLKSAKILGLSSSSDITILEDHARFPDSMTTPWSPDHIADELSQKFSPSFQPGKSVDIGDSFPSSPAGVNIDILITFDKKGISSHANHISLYYGALKWLQGVDPAGNTIAMYSLTSTNTLQKYISLFDAPFSILRVLLSAKRGHGQGLPEILFFFSGISGYRTAQRAMTEGHKSQMLWFRYGWLGLSRYVSINDLVRQYPVA